MLRCVCPALICFTFPADWGGQGQRPADVQQAPREGQDELATHSRRSRTRATM